MIEKKVNKLSAASVLLPEYWPYIWSDV